MKNSSLLMQRLHALLIPFVSALVLHGLFLSYLQLQRTSRKVPESLQSTDNTPELLQFSSQPAALSNLVVLPIPKARMLPPPRIQVTKASKPVRKTGNKIARVVLRKSSPPAPIPVVPKELVKAVEGLRMFRGSAERLRLSSEKPSTSQEKQPGSPTPSSLNPAEQASYHRLWNDARPQPRQTLLMLSRQLADQSLDIRSLPLKQAQNRGLPVEHQQILVLDDRVALFWLDGQRLWILQTLNDSAPTVDPAIDSTVRSPG